MSDAPPLTRLDRRTLLGVGAAGLLVSACATVGRPAARQTVWTFDRLSDIGGERTMVEGGPALIDSPYGQAMLFDGVDDALFIDRHPLAGAQTFTFEALFRPDGGAFEQRWFHLAEKAPAGQPPSQTRFLFEIRVVGDRWYLDAFTRGPGYNHTLIFPERLYPCGQWSHVAQTFDGAAYRAYVDGVLQGQAPLAFTPQGPGRASVGCRMNRVNFFKGAVRQARFTHAALTPEQFTMR
ncbi:MAG: LamG-like jellyroll fold domain-containing protein [Brevundimonas sp.]|uniref:LamG-like jellyroll fold domain-containing protein n=1 Tax=Brevundimonas sp. TaxID=1871086 RepID=UPI0028D3FDE4|nr:LamG-like jellyroll fold domain-containing protein [uncultured Brevundimonas sp.]